MRQITKINVWKSNSGEFRIYITFENEKNQGVYYKTGNAYDEKGKLENLTIEEKNMALTISEKVNGKNKWGNVYENQILAEVNKDASLISDKVFENKMRNLEDAETFGYHEKVNYSQRPSIEGDYV